VTHLEESLQRDIDRISGKVRDTAALAEDALCRSMTALSQKNRQLAYSVILRDQRIDELEKELDRLCFEFIVPTTGGQEPALCLRGHQDQLPARTNR
jgi:phosphate transport system protein